MPVRAQAPSIPSTPPLSTSWLLSSPSAPWRVSARRTRGSLTLLSCTGQALLQRKYIAPSATCPCRPSSHAAHLQDVHRPAADGRPPCGRPLNAPVDGSLLFIVVYVFIIVCCPPSPYSQDVHRPAADGRPPCAAGGQVPHGWVMGGEGEIGDMGYGIWGVIPCVGGTACDYCSRSEHVLLSIVRTGSGMWENASSMSGRPPLDQTAVGGKGGRRAGVGTGSSWVGHGARRGRVACEEPPWSYSCSAGNEATGSAAFSDSCGDRSKRCAGVSGGSRPAGRPSSRPVRDIGVRGSWAGEGGVCGRLPCQGQSLSVL